ncbi:Z1 domain-containing protein [Sporobacter termitidis DSM 10068]|uniref:Z1 domain-containing protein n=1 Tax=Sporobacter termitidis DSM 10068 TaxID=1123282 RepID=A0A1M5U116_9FIRM|nr:Z1 domain-containing protein [Sporobacter termitidis]SHH56727.1 Z1 domain-containing protein [Sporobacter termitidis DSM 10068]
MDREAISRIAVEYCWSMMEKATTFEEASLKTIEFVKSNLPGGSEIDAEWFKEHLKLSITQEVSDYLMLQGEDQNSKEKWWAEQKSQNQLGHWSRWIRYLIKAKNWSPAVIDSLDKTTDKILDAVDDPKRSSLLSDRRGLVLGYVQSGKTAHYTGLINKALDAGFQLVIVLAGMHDSLRIQTQTRLDEEVLGFETSIDVLLKNGMVGKRIGVGELSYPPELKLRTYTTRDPKGDFNKARANKIEDLEGRPSVFIVKKNATVLKNLYQFFRTGNLTKDHLSRQGKAVIANISMLMIDDEADQASVNTKAISDEDGNILPDYEPSRVNAEIRRIYNLFSNKAYVGYTATPYANIFIHDEASTEEYGSELFPKDFILSLPKPSNYIGPAEFFGLNRNDGQTMNLIREVQYDPLFVPAKVKKGHVPERLPETLVDAMEAFLISCSIRLARKQEDAHMSMLIHAARFTDIHYEIKDLVVRKIQDIKNRLRYENKTDLNSFANRLKILWENDFIETSLYMRDNFYDLAGDCQMPDWPITLDGIIKVLDKLEVLAVNGISDDELQYRDFSQGRIVIAVGGDKLSRGLTLEGLTTSYFLRSSTFYDTLMQMGRWFGYRPGYLDLCRLYTTHTLSEWFEHIAVATEELRSELFDMDQRGSTPKDYGLKVQTHSELFIAAKNKMQAAYEMQDDYSNSVSETTKFELDEDFFRDNQSAVDHFIRQLGTPDNEYLRKKRPSKYAKVANMPKHYFWDHVDGFSICSFLSEYKTARNAPRANSTRLKEYIRKQIDKDGLTDWTVCLINADESGHQENKTYEIGGLPISRGVIRSRGVRSEKKGAKAFGRLLSQDHEYLDFDDEQMSKVIELRDKATSVKGKRSKIITDNANIGWEAATYIRRELRSSQYNHGLLLLYPIEKSDDSAFSDLADDIVPIGIGLVFPPSHESTPVAYMANNVFRALEEEDEQE